MNEKSNSGPPSDPEILAPGSEDQISENGDLPLLAFISNYTDRPDLFLDSIERHDPGFLKKMNESAERHNEQLREGKYNFGKYQAYTSLVVAVIAAFAILAFIGLAVWKDAGFFPIIALGIVYAITQSGSAGFLKVIAGATKILKGSRTKSEIDD